MTITNYRLACLAADACESSINRMIGTDPLVASAAFRHALERAKVHASKIAEYGDGDLAEAYRARIERARLESLERTTKVLEDEALLTETSHWPAA